MTEAEIPLDAERILRALADHVVNYVLIGGLAVQTHGHVRTTNDADLIPAPDPPNLARLAAALRSLDARVLNPGEEAAEIDAKMLPRTTIWQFATLDDLIQMKLARGRPTDLADVASLTDPDVGPET